MQRSSRSISVRLATLEALEAAQHPGRPAFVCMHPRDYAVLDDVATPPQLRAAIAEAYGLGGAQQKLYVGLCSCAWDDDGRTCRVCADRPVLAEL